MFISFISGSSIIPQVHETVEKTSAVETIIMYYVGNLQLSILGCTEEASPCNCMQNDFTVYVQVLH